MYSTQPPALKQNHRCSCVSYQRRSGISVLLILALLIHPLISSAAWNDPYSALERETNTLYSSFAERPKHLDPARSYSSDEYAFIAQIYEPLLQYHFLKRPYTLIPLATTALPEVVHLDADLLPITAGHDRSRIAYSEYHLSIKPDIHYQPHPALATNELGDYQYHTISTEQLKSINTLNDFKQSGTRSLTAADYVYQIKRLANPSVHSPIAGVMAQYIVGFDELTQQLKQHTEQHGEKHPDLRKFNLEGVHTNGDHELVIRLKGVYPQFKYWLAMPFFAPMPWEVDRFYQQPDFEQKNLNLDWYPIGTGPFMLTENNPNLRMVMERNPNFHGERYPTVGEDLDQATGVLADAGKPLPFVDKAVYSLEKESIPRWNKFLQGYYDNSGISSDSFDQAVQFNSGGEAVLTDQMIEQGISLSTSVAASSIYMGFNMLDPVIGGNDERARLLRQAISIAVDYEEYISIFANGRGIPAQGPLPPGIYGHRSGEQGLNAYVYDWMNGRPKRKSLDQAIALLASAGYPNGIDSETGKPLAINFEAVSRGPDDKARLNWLSKQFSKLGIQLVIRATDYNRFREKMLKGSAQIFMWGWNADYPDPENFMFLLYGPNSKANHNGENAANYNNPEFDRLFERMKNMENGEPRLQIIDQMTEILRRDSPWLFGFHPKSFSLHHDWYHNVKPNLMANNTLKYKRVDPKLRADKRERWNPPVIWPFIVIVLLLLLSIIPAALAMRRRERAAAL